MLPALSLGLLALGLLFNQEIRAAVSVWILSTAYGHCFFIIPIALFLAWERRAAAWATPVRPMPLVALLALPFGFLWLTAERLGIMEGQQIMLMGFVELLFLAVLGWRLWWVLAVPLLYLGFLVPFGAFVTPALQDFTSRFITNGLDVLGIPNFTDGNTIEIPEGVFYVAEACAGLRFLIASIAFGVLYACMIYRSPAKRVLFIGASIVIPIIANGFRGLGIVALGHVLGSAEAAAVDHVLYGWIFFSIVIMLLILAGLPFREDGGPAPASRFAGLPSSGPRPVWAAMGAVLVLSAIAPAMAGWFDHRALAAEITAEGVGDINGCVPATPAKLVAAGHVGWSYACDNGQLDLSIMAFVPRANSGAVTQQRRLITNELAAEDVASRPLATTEHVVWRMISMTEPDRMIATAEWLDGKPAPGGLAQRRLQAWNSVAGTTHAPVLITVATPSSVEHLSVVGREHAKTAILSLLAANPDLPARIVALSEAAAHAPRN